MITLKLTVSIVLAAFCWPHNKIFALQLFPNCHYYVNGLEFEKRHKILMFAQQVAF